MLVWNWTQNIVFNKKKKLHKASRSTFPCW